MIDFEPFILSNNLPKLRYLTLKILGSPENHVPVFENLNKLQLIYFKLNFRFERSVERSHEIINQIKEKIHPRTKVPF